MNLNYDGNIVTERCGRDTALGYLLVSGQRTATIIYQIKSDGILPAGLHLDLRDETITSSPCTNAPLNLPPASIIIDVVRRVPNLLCVNYLCVAPHFAGKLWFA